MTAKELAEVLLQHPEAAVHITLDSHTPKEIIFKESVEQGETACLILTH